MKSDLAPLWALQALIETQKANSKPRFLLPAGVCHRRPLATTTFTQPLMHRPRETRGKGLSSLWMLCLCTHHLERLRSQLGTIKGLA